MFYLKRNRDLLEKIRNYFNQLSRSMDFFEEAFRHYLKKGADEHYEVLVRKMHGDESGADDTRRQIELEIYEKSLLPEFQGDVLTIIEKIDRIASKAEAVLYMVQLQKIKLLHPLVKDTEELLAISMETYKYTVEAALSFFGNMEEVRKLAKIVDNNESIGDRLERKMVKIIFEEKMDVGEKILQKDLIVEIGNICDLCENAMDSIVISAVKRKI